MTREEQIAAAFDDYSDSRKLSTFGDFEYADIKVAFEEGAEWADANPKSQWISVDDDLPCNHEELIASEPWDKHTKPVVVCNRHYGISAGIMIYNIDRNAWNWVGLTPTHWFPIPNLPKE